mmetsp:Transcript_85324/g.226129  ORF Transcript_85324/g.226129 Transcript_85324/m.226129 type:complete len:116 (+) Transcript_85324:2-349(+)
MADADVKLTVVTKDGAKMADMVPAGAMAKTEGKNALAGKWQITGGPSVTLTVEGNTVKSVEAPFGKQPLLGEIDESDGALGIHITLGGFPMKAWLKSEGGSTQLQFSNGGRWTKL